MVTPHPPSLNISPLVCNPSLSNAERVQYFLQMWQGTAKEMLLVYRGFSFSFG